MYLKILFNSNKQNQMYTQTKNIHSYYATQHQINIIHTSIIYNHHKSIQIDNYNAISSKT